MLQKMTPGQRKIFGYALIAIFVLGIIATCIRMAFSLLAVPLFGVGVVTDVPTWYDFLVSLVSWIPYHILPYFMASGAVAAFLSTWLFPDDESRGVLVGWGILMTLHLLASRFFVWL